MDVGNGWLHCTLVYLFLLLVHVLPSHQIGISAFGYMEPPSDEHYTLILLLAIWAHSAAKYRPNFQINGVWAQQKKNLANITLTKLCSHKKTFRVYCITRKFSSRSTWISLQSLNRSFKEGCACHCESSVNLEFVAYIASNNFGLCIGTYNVARWCL
jgi:hypothetical protein